MGKVASENTLKQIMTCLTFLTAGGRDTIYSDPAKIARAIRSGTLESNRVLFPVGEQLVVPWRDMDDSAHNSAQSAYNAIFDIVDHRLVLTQDGQTRPAMLLQMHAALPFAIQFSHAQAFYNVGETGLMAGTYRVRLGAGVSGQYVSGETITFTLTQGVPANGRLAMSPKNADAYAISSYAPDASTAIETVSGMIGAQGEAIDLGVTNAGGLNTVNRMCAGSNRWDTSGARAWLNAKGKNWYKATEQFDLAPVQAARYGFLSGFEDSFLRAIKPIRVSFVTGNGAEETFDRFFLPCLQELNVTPQSAVQEGTYFEYWRSMQEADGYVGSGSGHSFDCFKIKDLADGGPRILLLRSANLSNDYALRRLLNNGYVSPSSGMASYYADNAGYVAPVCAIC